VAAKKAPAHGRLDLSGASILIVEDNDDSREMLRQMVESFGAEVTTARYGREAIDHVTRTIPDLVLCDLVMPGVDGFQFVEWLRRQPGERGRVPVIAVTALGTQADFERTMAAGFTGHLLKPIDYGMVDAQLRRVF
jgi:CheY-like chemotaxis protein